jgi:hypothetical protein
VLCGDAIGAELDHISGPLVVVLAGADAYERELLDAFDERRPSAVGRYPDTLEARDAA